MGERERGICVLIEFTFCVDSSTVEKKIDKLELKERQDGQQPRISERIAHNYTASGSAVPDKPYDCYHRK